jgi:Holliday junction resolvase
MAATPEKKVKQRVVAQLKALGAYYFYPVTGGFGSSGVPDVVCCLDGRFIGIECKAGKGKTTALQDKNLREIEAAGGVALVINEDNVDNLTGIIREWLDILELSRNKRTRTTD